MAGLLYLPRIFVYHVENFEKKQTTEVFEIMEKRLFNYIMKPAMVLSWLLGLILILIIGIETFSFLWLQIKLILVFLLSVYNDYLGKCMRLLKSGENEKSSKFYRRINEIPTVLLIFIVFIVIFKPL
jgi:putative membrane protein